MADLLRGCGCAHWQVRGHATLKWQTEELEASVHRLEWAKWQSHLALSQHKGKIIAAYYSQAVRGLKIYDELLSPEFQPVPPQCLYHFKISDVRAQDKDAATLVRPLLSKLDDRRNERPRSVSLSAEIHHQVHRKVPVSPRTRSR